MTQAEQIEDLQERVAALEDGPPPSPSIFAQYSKALGSLAGPAVLLVWAWFFNTPHVLTAHEQQAIGLALVGGPLGTIVAPKNAPKPRTTRRRTERGVLRPDVQFMLAVIAVFLVAVALIVWLRP